MTKEKIAISINPPPQDGRCECCRRHVSELKVYGGPGDPLVGDFTGAKLIKTFKSLTYSIKEYDIILDEVEQASKNQNNNYESFEEMLIAKVGEKEAVNLMLYSQLVGTVGAEWICRDCILLDDEEYYKKKEKSYLEMYGEDKDAT